jgi:two-component system chemotaxis response regulator CheY
MRKMVMTALRPLAPSYGEASNGLHAIEQLAVRHYDAMTLDLNMPDMHGLEVIQFVRSYEAYRMLPIVVLTTRQEEQVREAVLSAGADVFITKPFKPGTLLDEVRRLLAAAPAP